MVKMGNKKCQENAEKYYCKICDFKCCKLSNFETHKLTDKHKNNENGNRMVTNDTNLSKKNATYICDCGNIYKHQSGLSRHKKKCQVEEELEEKISVNNKTSDQQLIMMLIKDNSELRNLMMKVIENGTNNTTITTTNTNSHNKAFNLNFFLNETCKNAMNITEFVDSIKLQLTDLVNVGEKGYIEGISDIIVKNLKNMDETERPVHCADKKREICYIKDEGKWEKDEDKKKMKQIVKKVAYKNERLLPLFKEEYPDYNDSDSIRSDQYSKIVIEAMGGIDGNSIDKEDKIIKNISKAAVINKCI
jgi:hypothetical protein